MAHEELKPCPFCGSRSSIEAGGHIYKGGGVVAYIQCVECGTHGPFTRTQKDAIEAWNRRLSEVGDHLAQVRLAGPYNDKYCNNPHAPEVCRHYEADYKCLKFNVEDLAMACVDPTPETFYPAAVRCAACLREGGGVMASRLMELYPEVFHDALFRPVEKCVMHKSGLFCVLYDFDGPSICHVQSGKELIGYAPDRLILSIIEKFCEISDCFEHLSLDDKFQPIWSDDRARETVMSLINRINLEIEIDGLQSDLHRHEEDKASAEDEIQETLREIEKLNAEKEALLKPLEAGGAKQ